MIRAVVLALTLAACARAPGHARCDVSVEHDLAFSAPNDHVTARALGVACDKAVALYVVTSPDGHPIWSWSAPMAHAFGDQFNQASEQDVAGFLAGWAEPRVTRTSTAPAWSSSLATHYDRLTYEDVRARDLPLLCHLTGITHETCVYWEPAAAAGAALFERDVPESAASD